jgi:ankyrin repeat protein
MANYLHSKLKAGRSKQVEQIKDEILERASGIFLWVVLVVKMLNTEFDRGRIYALRKRLDKIPNGLDELFSDILTRDSQNMEEMILSLQWILYAKRPLKREELYFAILAGVEPEAVTSWDPEEVTMQDIERFVLSSSKGLADVTKSKDQTVQFIHESVRDFLLKGSGLNTLRTNLTSNFPGQSHERLKQCCETYMRIDTSEHLPLSIPLPNASSKEAAKIHRIASQKFPFLEYSVLNVLHHADVANGYGISQDVFVENFVLRDWIDLDNYFERYQIRRHTSNGSLIYILAEQNLPNLIRIELKRVPHMDIKGERYGFPLLAALALKNESAVRALLAPDISLSGSRDHQGAVRCVLENSGDINSQKDQSLLSWAAARGNSGLVTFLLATRKVDIDSRTKNKRTPLSRAAEGGHEAVVKMLLETGQVEVDLKDTTYRQTPLSRAAEGGHEAVVKMLLETGQVEVDSKDFYRQTPLSRAAGGGHEAVVKMLLETDQVEVDSKDSNSRTPFSWAAGGGHEAVVKMLLETGQVEVDSKDRNSRTPLSWAAGRGREAVVKMLLERGQVEVDSKNSNSQTPFSWAAEGGHEAVVKMLLETGQVEVDSKE